MVHGQPRAAARLAPGAILSLIAAGLACYWNSRQGVFIFDDLTSIVGNHSIRDLATALHPPGGGKTVSARPLLNLSFAINYGMGHLRPAGYHMFNLGVHILAGLTLFSILRRTWDKLPIGWAWAAALLWIVHPLQTESVTYLSQRAECLAGLFYLATLYAFIRGSWEWGVFSVLFCWAGILTKETVITAPIVVLLYDRAFISGSVGAALRARWQTYAGLAVAWIPAAYLIIHSHGRGGTVGFGHGVGWIRYLGSQGPAILHYLRLVVWPHPLVFDYGMRWTWLSLWVVTANVVVVLLLIAFLVNLWRNHPSGFCGIAFFLLMAPTSLVPGVRQAVAEHRMYLPLAVVIAGALGALASSGMAVWFQRRGVVLAVAVAAVLGTLTVLRNRTYHSALGVWADTVKKLPENPYSRYSLGEELLHQGNYTEAEAQFRTALQLKPDYALAQNNLGSALWRMGRGAEAMQAFATATRLDGTNTEAHNNLGNVLLQQRRLFAAEQEFKAALAIDPDFAEAHNGLGCVLSDLPNDTAAIAEFQEALRLDPNYAEARMNLANAYIRLNRRDEARAVLEEEVRLRPTDAVAHCNLGSLYLLAGQKEAAEQEYEAALRIQPHFDKARRLLDRLEDSK